MSPPVGELPNRHRGRTGVIGVLVATGISTLGSRMTAVAIPWLVLVTTGDPVLVGLVSAAEMLPYVLSSVLTAPLEDRIGSRRLVIVADVVSAVTVAAIAAGHEVHFGLLLALVAIGGSLRASGDRGRATVLRPFIDDSGIEYARVTSAYQGITRTAGLVGVFAGGVVIAVLGAEGALVLNAVAFAVCAAIMTAWVPRPTQDSLIAQNPKNGQDPKNGRDSQNGKDPKNGKESYFGSIRAGFAFFRRDRLLPNLTSMLVVTNLFNQASAVIFIPLWVLTQINSPVALGVVAGSFAVGAIAGNVVFTMFAPYIARYPALVFGYFIGGAPRYVVLAVSDDLTVVVVAMAVSGFVMCSVNPTIGAVIYQRVPADQLARTNGIIAAAAYAGLPLGGIVGSLLVTGLGYTNGVLVGAAVYFLATLAPVLRPGVWREVDDTRKRPNIAGKPRVSLPLALPHYLRGTRVRLTYAEGTWSVRVRRGLRTLVPSTTVGAPHAVRALAQLDNDQLRAAVADAASTDFARAARRMATLRARLDGATFLHSGWSMTPLTVPAEWLDGQRDATLSR